MKYAHFFGLKIKNEYFQKNYANFITNQINEINPDICILKEFYTKEDRQLIISKLKNQYPFNCILNSWYRENSIIIFSKKIIETKILENTSFYNIKINNFTFIPIHLNSFSAQKRLMQIKSFLNKQTDCILGDTNFWCFGKKHYFLYKKDKIAYKLLSEKFVDTTKNNGNTTKYFLNFDKIFLNQNIKYKKPTCIRKNKKYIDHYPVFVDIK